VARYIHLGLGVALLAHLSIGAAFADAEECPLDRITFVDSQTGKAFAAMRVAVQYGYDCENGYQESDRPLKDKTECRGPFGETIIEGLLGARTAYAVSTVADALPCCVWYSYSDLASIPYIHEPKWLAPAEVPTAVLENKWFTIGPPNPPYDPDTGPMGGGEFVAKICRPKN